jgi:hypothetical protein
VFEVVPQAVAERRGAEERRRDPAPDVVIERRAAHERRVRARPRAALGGALADGWLCFLAGEERRRIAPIPTGWERLDDHALLALLARAPGVVPRGGSLGGDTLRGDIRRAS